MRPRKPTAALACCVALVIAVHASDNTHIDNHSKKWTIIATTSYPHGTSKFINRKIPPGGSDFDSYSNKVDEVEVQVQVEGAPFHNHFSIASDDSLVAEDNPDNIYGVDFWLNDGNGNALKSKALLPYVTIFGPGPPAAPSPSPPSSTTAPRGALYWENPSDEGCKSPGYRQMHFPADIKGVGPHTQHFYQPDRCINTNNKMWGEFDYPGSNNRQFKDDFRVPVFRPFPANAPPVQSPTAPVYLPAPSEEFDATWVPVFKVGDGPLNTPSFSQLNPGGGVIDIPKEAYVTISEKGPNMLLTAQLTGCAFVWAYDSDIHVFYAAHIQSDDNNINDWARDGTELANNLTFRARFHGTEMLANVYGRNGFGYSGGEGKGAEARYGNILAVRNGNGWKVIAQAFPVDQAVPTYVKTVDYDDVRPRIQ
ncbi:hypothetical protein WJX74_009172 [Apatococcus lobatus]|uniref:Uncharacterized protein n=1 Tax=Apatococcus lobatus TaxID=904363 RepID=A0AAW1QYD5_9CHLO